ncbi:MAG TPA: 3-deoxy-manno-octulosonate cytidylyltransferase [Lentisphaeria bacterium]|nr:MAG: hypothetical protein A2X47_06450 [Lentisphaerae bacterium GWF2_38_69]HBM15529.1 3-deoxy-manno-octulosonate cytidylyltransferase [Lentisphaeria bacterium]
MKHKGTLVCIPARYGSTRFPGKPLAKLGGKPIIQWVYEKGLASKAESVLIATDNDMIFSSVKSFGANCVMTSDKHPSGTDRVWEAVKDICCDVIINIQGDEPLIEVSTIDSLIDMFASTYKIEMGTVVAKADRNVIGTNPNVVKAVLGKDNTALYFSRAEIPYVREPLKNFPIYKHLGIYGYRKKTLEKIISLPQSELEQCEMLEQLRALDNGIRIHALIVESDSGIGIDTPEDLMRAEAIISNKHIGT